MLTFVFVKTFIHCLPNLLLLKIRPWPFNKTLLLYWEIEVRYHPTKNSTCCFYSYIDFSISNLITLLLSKTDKKLTNWTDRLSNIPKCTPSFGESPTYLPTGWPKKWLIAFEICSGGSFELCHGWFWILCLSHMEWMDTQTISYHTFWPT